MTDWTILFLVFCIGFPIISFVTQSYNSTSQGRQDVNQRDNILKHALYWEKWTGARFVRIENPIATMSRREYMRSEWSRPGEMTNPKIENHIAKQNPVTLDYYRI